MMTENRPSVNSDLAVSTAQACADELNELARDLVHIENGICDLASERITGPSTVKSLQDLDRIQQTMLALATVLQAIGRHDVLEETISNLPLASLRLKLQYRDFSETRKPGILSLF